MNIVSMQLSAEEAKEESMAYTAEDEDGGPKYPWGLSLDICDETMKKLGMTAMPNVGDTMVLTARVKVTRTSAYEEQKGTDLSFGLQITDMGLAPEDQPSNLAGSLYGS